MTAFSADDHRWMARALRLARNGLNTSHPNPRVGCVLVQDNACVGEGWHQRAGEPHAEVFALDAAGVAARGATAYVTLEPCAHTGSTPPCADALVAAGVARVVVATADPYEQVAGRGLKRLRAAGIEVQTGLLEAQARDLNSGFFSRIQRRRPWLRLKLAGSLDGVSAMASGESQWITSAQARDDGHRWRAQAAAVMTGSGTLLADNPRLDARGLDCGESVAIVVDSQWRMDRDAAVVQANQRVLWLGSEQQPVPPWAQGHSAVESIGVPESGGGLDLALALRELADRQINEVHVEAGARLSGALLAEGLVDEILMYLAPRLLGSGNRGLAAIPGADTLAAGIHMQWIDSRRIGDDWRLRLKPVVTPQAGN